MRSRLRYRRRRRSRHRTIDRPHRACIGGPRSAFSSRAYWGRGLAGEAVSVVLSHAFGPLGLHRVEAYADPRNRASLRCLERAGFRTRGRHARAMARCRGDARGRRAQPAGASRGPTARNPSRSTWTAGRPDRFLCGSVRIRCSDTTLSERTDMSTASLPDRRADLAGSRHGEQRSKPRRVDGERPRTSSTSAGGVSPASRGVWILWRHKAAGVPAMWIVPAMRST